MGLNVMLEKMAGNFNIEKLQIILLFEGDFNTTINGWEEQSCSMQRSINKWPPSSMAVNKRNWQIRQCLNKWLLYEYAHYMHKPLAICSNNAKSCYDHIVLIVAALCLCRLGAPKPVVQSMVLTIQGMQHHVQSTYGDSMQSQGCTQWLQPIAGIGQGNSASPHI